MPKQKKFNPDVAMPWRPRLKVFGGRNCTFNPETTEALSYNWWIFVKKIKGVWVFNDYRYSMTTSGHQNRVSSFLWNNKITKFLSVEIKSGLQDFKHGALPPLYREMCVLELELKRRGVKRQKREARIKEIKATIKACRKLGATMGPGELKRIKEEALNEEVRRKAAMAAKREENRNIRAANKQLLNA